MYWRDAQLADDLCDQDRLVLSIIGNQSVRLWGNDAGFSKFCEIDPKSDFYLLYFNQPLWLSEIRDQFDRSLSEAVTKCYIGINRYLVLGNDLRTSDIISQSTYSPGSALLATLSQWAEKKNFRVIDSGFKDDDLGRYFNFVQPLTWMYIKRETNPS